MIAHTVQLNVFVAVHDENSLGWTLWQHAINIRNHCESRFNDWVVALLSSFYHLQRTWNFPLEKVVWPIGFFQYLLAISVLVAFN